MKDILSEIRTVKGGFEGRAKKVWKVCWISSLGEEVWEGSVTPWI